MIPKLVANLCGEKAPAVIVLYKGEVPSNSDVARDDQKRFIYVDIHNPDFGEIIRRLGDQAGTSPAH
jgi:hypothetical protein